MINVISPLQIGSGIPMRTDEEFMSKQFSEYEKTWSFSTAGAKPLVIKLTTHCSGHFHERQVYLEMTGLLDPCLSLGRGAGYIGKETKNPALYAAMDFISALVQQQAEASSEKRNLSRSIVYGKNETAIESFNDDSISSMTMRIPFNHTERCVSARQLANTRKASDDELAGFAGDIQDAIDRARPEIEKLIADNAHLQPNPEKVADREVARRRYDQASLAAYDGLNLGLQKLGPQYRTHLPPSFPGRN